MNYWQELWKKASGAVVSYVNAICMHFENTDDDYSELHV
jgi:hypothetical protein